MKSFLVAASCLAIVLPATTFAQDNPDRGNKPPPPGRPAGGGQNRPAPGGAGPQFRPGPGNPGVRPGSGGGGGGGNRPGPGVTRPAPQYGVNRPAPGGGRPGHNRPGNRPGGWAGNRGSWGWNGQRYRGGRFNYPSGFGYQRWVIGGILPAIFLSHAYYFADYASLGFEAPPWGYQWVRYGPDLLLVNSNNGQVMDVEYGVFY